MIAHRLATIANADRIFVVDEGRIVERASHAELLERKGSRYSRLHAAQAGSGVVRHGATRLGAAGTQAGESDQRSMRSAVGARDRVAHARWRESQATRRGRADE